MKPILTTLRVITPPTKEPLTLAQVKIFCRIYTDWEDSLVSSLLTTARMGVEQYLGRVLVTQTLLWTVKTLPYSEPYRGYPGFGLGDAYWAYGLAGGYSNMDGSLQLPRSPVQSITSVTLRDHHGVDTVVNNTVYNLDTELDPARFHLKWHEVIENFPTVDPLRPLQHIAIEFVAGFGGSEYNEAIPSPILQAIYLYVAYLYENRGDSGTGTPDMPKAVYYLCDPYRIQSFGGQ